MTGAEGAYPSQHMPLGVDRAAAIGVLAEARRLYGVAELVHARSNEGSFDSAPIAQRSLREILSLLLKLYGEDEVRASFSEIAARARTVASVEQLTSRDVGPELTILDEMQGRSVRLETPSTEDGRRYDRAFVRSAEWFDGVEEYLDRRLPAPRAGLIARLTPVATVLFALLLGGGVGYHVRPFSDHAAAPDSQPAEAGSGAGFVATYYNDVAFKSPVLSRKESRISYNWEDGAPTGLALNDGFAVRWEGTLHVDKIASYTFYLTSDDGSKLKIYGWPIVDNGGSHVEVTKAETVVLKAGNHPIRVDYFDLNGKAMVRLEWSSKYFSRRLVDSTDLR